MKMRFAFIGVLLFSFLCSDVYSQTPENIDTVKHWKINGTVGVTMTQIGFYNWVKGGENSVTGSGLFNVNANYKKDRWVWENYLLLNFGMMTNDQGSIRKTDDRIDLNSKIGYQQWKELNWAFLVNFRTQFAKGYNYPNDSVIVSKIMTPGYLILSIGADYSPVDYLSLYFSPFTGKFIYVTDTSLADKWGVKSGNHLQPDFGWYFKVVIKKDVMENVSLSSKLGLFQNYTDKNAGNRANIDIDWEAIMIFKVNSFLSATFSWRLLYDHDIKVPIYEKINDVKTKIGEGPRTQFMEQLGLGIVLNF
jgi:hypothetical protein